MITSGVIGAEEEARSAALGQDYQVLKALSAGSLMPPLGKNGRLCFRGLPGASPSMPWNGQKSGHDTAGRPSVFGPCDHMAHCTRTTPKPTRLPPGLPRTLRHAWPSVEITAGCRARCHSPCTGRRHITCVTLVMLVWRFVI